MHTNPDSQGFEDVYQRCEFAPLVKLALGFASWLKNHVANKNLMPIHSDNGSIRDMNKAHPESG